MESKTYKNITSNNSCIWPIYMAIHQLLSLHLFPLWLTNKLKLVKVSSDVTCKHLIVNLFCFFSKSFSLMNYTA